MNKIRQYTYYITIFVASFITLAFLPMLGSNVELGWDLPTTSIGWLIWAVTKSIASFLNVLIFHSFIQQGKLNIADNENFKKAQQILSRIKDEEYHPRSEKKFLGKEYGVKGTTIFLFTAISTIALTQAILSYDMAGVITYVFTIISGLIFGILEMKKVETYYITEYLDYALLKEQYVNNNR